MAKNTVQARSVSNSAHEDTSGKWLVYWWHSGYKLWDCYQPIRTKWLREEIEIILYSRFPLNSKWDHICPWGGTFPLSYSLCVHLFFVAYFYSHIVRQLTFRVHCVFRLKTEPRIHLFSENSREHWARIGEQVMCRSVFSYILGLGHYAPNTFSAHPNLWKRWILVRILVSTVFESQFSWLLVNLCENAWECYEYSVFVYSWPFLKNRHMASSALRLIFNEKWLIHHHL